MSSDTGVTKSRSGGMSVCLSGPDGRVFGGGLAGVFMAAGPVQVRIEVLDELSSTLLEIQSEQFEFIRLSLEALFLGTSKSRIPRSKG